MSPRALDLGLRVVVAVMLVVTGLIHLHLAEFYPAGKAITMEQAFIGQAVLVLVLAAAVLLPPYGGRRPLRATLVWLAVLLAAAGSVAALLLAYYWEGADAVPGLLPERTWDVGDDYLGMSEKVLALVTEVVAAVIALGYLVSTPRKS
jgi:hypothetical protein